MLRIAAIFHAPPSRRSTIDVSIRWSVPSAAADAVVAPVGHRDIGADEAQRVDADRAAAARALLRLHRSRHDGVAAAAHVARGLPLIDVGRQQRRETRGIVGFSRVSRKAWMTARTAASSAARSAACAEPTAGTAIAASTTSNAAMLTHDGSPCGGQCEAPPIDVATTEISASGATRASKTWPAFVLPSLSRRPHAGARTARRRARLDVAEQRDELALLVDGNPPERAELRVAEAEQRAREPAESRDVAAT